MPNSLKCRLKSFAQKGYLSEKDLSRIYTDNDVVEELEKIKAELLDKCPNTMSRLICYNLIAKHIEELKGESK